MELPPTPEPAPTKPSTLARAIRNPLVTAVVALVVGIGIGAASAGGNPGKTAAAATPSATMQTTSPPTVAPTSSTSSAPAPAIPDPKATYTHSCDYLLGDFTESASGFRFIGSAKIKNTGNIGIVVTVTATWGQLGTAPIKVVKTARVPVNGSKTVQMTKVATSNQIDLQQAGNIGGQGCNVKVSISDEFGSVS
jgi:hypothetical protein